MYRNILIPTDGSELATRAVDKGVELAKALGAKVTAVTVTEPFHVFTGDVAMVGDTPEEWSRHAEERAQAVLHKVRTTAEHAGVPCETVHVSEDDAYEGIITAAAKAGCDMIAMASHGRGAMATMVLGSQTRKVLARTTLPVVVFR